MARKRETGRERALARDLENLILVRGVGAIEAVAFYAARILERVIGDAIERLRTQPSGNLFGNLRTLEDFGRLPKAAGYFAHAVRRIGNDARHLGREIVKSDADSAIGLLARFLDWELAEWGSRSGVEEIRDKLSGLELTFEPGLGEVLMALGRQPPDRTELQALWDSGRNDVFVARTPIPAALYADHVLDGGEPDRALEILSAGLARFPRDLRLRQLQGLALRRAGRTGEARIVLRALYDENPNDEETVGIYAGTLKNIWASDAQNEESALREAQRRYQREWERTGSFYLGVNAASCLLLLGEPAASRSIAAELRSQMLARWKKLGEDRSVLFFGVRSESSADAVVLNYWDTVTWAELELLLGSRHVAERFYRDALAANAGQAGAVGATRKQLALLLPRLGIDQGVEEFLSAGTRAPAAGAIVLGVTGHRRLPAASELAASLGRVLDELPARLGRAASTPYHLLTPLAEGADRLAAEAVFSRPNATLEAVLPLEIADYETDFETAQAKAAFRAWLGRCSLAGILGPASDRNAAYEAVGRRVADRCEVLLAFWDGEPPRGRGGTAEIVAYARETGRALVWLRTIPPCKVEFERIREG
ncbi:MAG: DUF4145 domain-containing protein [Planctomycetes bacterium]|nr:DUF4145 domain-containing protein [Planctomycetota bacterium]